MDQQGRAVVRQAQAALDRPGEKKGNVQAGETLRGTGVTVRLREERPLPDLLISIIKASLQPEAGTSGNYPERHARTSSAREAL